MRAKSFFSSSDSESHGRTISPIGTRLAVHALDSCRAGSSARVRCWAARSPSCSDWPGSSRESSRSPCRTCPCTCPPIPWGVMRGMVGAGAEVHKEGAFRRNLLGIGDHADGMIDQVGGQVIIASFIPACPVLGRGCSTNCWSCTRSGYYWLVSPPRKP